MPNTLQLTSTLADETRYSIYQYIVKEAKVVSVQEIADQFGIHPNVARLHLSKLNDSNFLRSELIKNRKGGRPARIYSLAENPVYLSFPKQEDHLLLQWLIDLVSSLGEQAIVKGKEIAYENGKQLTSSKLTSPASFEEKIQILTANAASIGYFPTIQEKNHKKVITFAIYNCPYKNHLKSQSELICALHESFLRGQFDALFPTNDFIQLESMQDQCQNCLYHIEVL
ncbi:metalloregulator ArsR/SmtB family transcription factor [Psychrobacillus sp. FJAT-21963]|uniref:helix-turn-helix transcriptional regulator n=1 Tax=Psychrobacillus sp. FJAT-21963 TaxID=1712028 RepID=UPI0006FA7FC9|nr:helix-turn-helix domain-containing protein [Psychrobacillus sp. FJAT-21963]KQL34245.1 transcriptional regulator [Psychrobacillus sp. FJAT-21963]